MASIQARHQRKCALGRPWTTFADATTTNGCTCEKPGPLYYSVTRVDGKLVREPIGHNRRNAERELTKVQAAVNEDTYEPPSPVTFDQWADQFLAGLRRRPTTHRQYAVTLNYARAVFGPKKLRKLTAADVRALLEHVEEANRKRKRKTSQATLAKHLRQLSTCLEAARVEGLLPVNPVRRMHSSSKPKAATKPPSYFTDDELPRLWPELAHREPYLFAAKLAVTTGMRFGEVSGLHLSDLHLLDGEIHLRRQWTAGAEVDTTKSGKPRTVDLVPQAQQVLADWLRVRGPDEGLLFEREVGGNLDNDEGRDLLYAAMKRAGIARVGEQGGKRDWHSLRHTFARVVLENGALVQWVQGQLGHSSAKLTTDLYGRWSRSAQKREAEAQAGVFPV
jgi:integrase